MSKQEIEIRAKLSKDQIKNFDSKIKKLGAKAKDKQTIHDIYYCPNSVKQFIEIEMDEVGSYSLRLRERQKEGLVEYSINTKIITSYGDHNAWDEFETKLDSFEDMKNMLQAIGFKNYFELDKERIVYKIKDLEVNLEMIKNFGGVIEVEIIADKTEANESKLKIMSFLKNFGISEKQIYPKSVTNFLMKTRSKF